MNFSQETKEFDPPYQLVAEDTQELLDEQHARAHTDYYTWKENVMDWLTFEGKDPEAWDGYSEETLRQTNYKIDQIMRWLWGERGYTTELTPDDADQLMRELARYKDYSQANLNTFIKSIKRLFKWYNHEKGKSYSWEPKLKVSEPKVTNRDYFYKEEFLSLYEAALEYGTVRHYHSCTPEERDELKAHLAQRFEMEKSKVGPDEFDQANSFKIPSIISVSLDVGLRPIEVSRAKVDWVNFEEETLDIPARESSKNKDNWKCVLSNKSVRALKQWRDERGRYKKYEGRDELWLNKRGNPYNTDSLNYILNDLIEMSGIDPNGRDLSFYSIRHGTATIWADEEDLNDASEQLRHKKIETTLGYAHSSPDTRHNKKNSKW